jgi:hypothetical protein
MTSYYAGFETGFQGFGITLPTFALPASAARADFDAYLQREPVVGQPLGKVSRGYSIGEIDFGVRFKLLDTFGWPVRPPEPEVEPAEVMPAHAMPPVAEQPTEEEADDPEAEGVDGEAAGQEEVAEEAIRLDPAGEQAAHPEAGAAIPLVDDTAQVAPPVDRGGIRFRTTVGARYRFALKDPDRDPYLVPDVFLQQPIGDGQPDIALEVYQDVAFGSRFWLVAGAEYGIQMQDELVRRVALPDQPYALASQEVTVSRDLGDYLQIVVSPRFALADALSLALEYTYWSKQDDQYEAVGSNVDATPLTVETGQTRHLLGIGAYYRTTRLYAAGLSGLPIDLAFVWETAIGGSGGQTPAASVVTVSARVPFKLF